MTESTIRSVPSLRVRVAIAVAIGLFCALLDVIGAEHALAMSDFDQCWVAAWALLAFAITRRDYHRLLLFLSAGFSVSPLKSQCEPLLTATARGVRVRSANVHSVHDGAALSYFRHPWRERCSGDALLCGPGSHVHNAPPAAAPVVLQWLGRVVIVTLMYMPCLIMVLRRRNEGELPTVVATLLARVSRRRRAAAAP